MAITALSDEFTVSTSDETGCVEPSVAGHDDGSYLITWDGIHVFDFYSEAWGRTFDLLTPSSDEFPRHSLHQPACARGLGFRIHFSGPIETHSRHGPVPALDIGLYLLK